MYSKLAEKLHFTLEPVAINFTDERPEEALQFEEGKRGCVASMLVTAANGKTAVFDDKTYGCPGGGVGICFGDTFTKNSHPTESLLSTGDEALALLGKTHTKSLGRGERFFATPELAGKWKSGFPYTEAPEKYVVFKPLSQTEESNPPDLICIFANPDQLSALVIMAGFNRGEMLNTVAPFSAACQSIAIAYQEINKELPKAIIGFFDISQRHRIPKEILSLTMPYCLYRDMEESLDESCLTTEAWEKIADRFQTDHQ